MSTEYAKPSVTVDVILTNVFTQEVLLVKRKNEPFKDFWAIPGGFFDPLTDDSIVYAARREFQEETSVEISEAQLFLFKIADKIGRDPRDRVISLVHYAEVTKNPSVKASDDAKELRWFKSNELAGLDLAFDHREILKEFFFL